MVAHTHGATYSGANFYLRHGRDASASMAASGYNTTFTEKAGETWGNGAALTSYSHAIDRMTIRGTVTISNNTATDATTAHNNLQPYMVVYIWVRTK